ncbi:MAG: helix-turn-helix domain-containing protein [Proteobacteria bacterium]|nr:helix-turn-helix domain-containing protein [Pseudomonadota bacterium]
MDCENLGFSRKLSKRRIAKAEKTLGKTLVRKILAFALFILGVDRTSIASRLDMPPGTVRSVVRSFNKDGAAAILDRRTRTRLPKTEQAAEYSAPCLETGDEYLKVVLSDGNTVVQVPTSNRVQKRVVLLTMLNSGILERSDAATALGLSEDRTAKLARKLGQHDVESIVDRRQGQQMEFRVTPRLKSELIQQFVLDIVTEGRTTGNQLARHLEERCRITLSSRTVLHHLSKLGLNHIKWSLPRLLEEAKKKSLKS